MLNIQATLNGEDYKEVSMPKEVCTYVRVKELLKGEFTLSTDEEIELYDADNVELCDASMASNSSKKLKVALLNKRLGRNPNLLSTKNGPAEEGKEVGNVLKDEISSHKYSCYSSG